MAPRKASTSGNAIKASTPPPSSGIRAPPMLRFPLFVVVSLFSSSLLYTVVAERLPIGDDLSGVSKSLNEWWEVGALIGWRTIELAIGWFGGYDSKFRRHKLSMFLYLKLNYSKKS